MSGNNFNVMLFLYTKSILKIG